MNTNMGLNWVSYGGFDLRCKKLHKMQVDGLVKIALFFCKRFVANFSSHNVFKICKCRKNTVFEAPCVLLQVTFVQIIKFVVE